MATNYDAEYAETMFILLCRLDKLSHGIQSATAHFADDNLSEDENKLRAYQIELLIKEANKEFSELNHVYSMWLGNRALRYRQSQEKTD